jgi:hypothetical protein
MSTRAEPSYTLTTTVKVTTTITTTIRASSPVAHIPEPTPQGPDLSNAHSPFPTPEELLMPTPGQIVEGYYLVTFGRECGIFFTL